MESSFSNAIPYLDSLNCVSLNLSRPTNHESFAGNAQLGQSDLFEGHTHSHLHSLSIKYLTTSIQPDPKDLLGERLGSSLENERIDDCFPYLNLSRGISENYEYFEEESCHLQVPYNLIQVPSLTHHMQFPEESRQMAPSAHHPSPLFLPISEQELKSHSKNNDFSYISGPDEEEGRPASKVGLKVTKNVTKNIGKLLFKFIWKHRRTLGQRMGIQRSQWQSFMKVISLWKKQNNITRQYLMRRWQGQGQHCTIFRRLSRHFFRMRCLPAIMKSHIGLKRVHFERIHRFSAAITDPEALASLV